MTGTHSAASSVEESGRKPAVAGRFYPADFDTLIKMVNKFIADGHPLSVAPKIITSPHAGYQFSGPVAGKGYATIDRTIRTVILLGPPHYVPVRGIAVPSAAWFETPLGKVNVDGERIRSLLKNSIAYADDRSHAPEHSLEVQLPFLQARLSSFTIVPLLVSQVDPVQAAECIYPLIDNHTLVVVSSDLSHYLSHWEAREEDDRSLAAIEAGDVEGMIDACGELPIRIAMVLAAKMRLKPLILDARTSYDTSPSFGSDRVVGYASLAFVPEPLRTASPAAAGVDTTGSPVGMLTDAIKAYLLWLARQSLEASVKSETCPAPLNIPESARENRGCFVTLTVQGELRGCIGYIEPVKPLYQTVMENARSAALTDPRFPRVAPGELSSIKIEISVLTKPTVLEYENSPDLLSKIVPKVDGIILRSGLHQSTFLPQVWEQLPDKTQFLEQLSLKAGMPRDGWKTAIVKRYRADHFSE